MSDCATNTSYLPEFLLILVLFVLLVIIGFVLI